MVFVDGIPWEAKEDSVRSALSKFGPVQEVHVSSLKGFAIVTFTRFETAESAISAHWHNVDNKLVEIKPYASKK